MGENLTGFGPRPYTKRLNLKVSRPMVHPKGTLLLPCRFNHALDGVLGDHERVHSVG